ncbi:MAG: hypothetical protein JOZ55_11085 [Alphaproteobacteria bacterium]|nr:hypothetical protein [Alphaproteobacteria bacterium]
MIRKLLKHLNPWGPVLFGVGFLAPLIATLVTRGGIASHFGVSALQAGIVIGASWGLYAKLRGSWI